MTFTYKPFNIRKCWWLTTGCLKGLTHCAEGGPVYQCQGYLSYARAKREQREKSEKILDRKVLRALRQAQDRL